MGIQAWLSQPFVENNSSTHKRDYLFNKIVDLNTRLSNQSYEELFGSKRTSKRNNKRYDGACKDGFYLGLKSDNELAILFQKYV